MKTTRSILLALVVLSALSLSAEITIPRPSPHASVSQTIGTTTITIDYHRPGVKGRAIWGALVPFDTTWRMGANEATTISFSDPVKIAGNEVPAGKYSFFAIPGRDKWTLILNKDPQQWGAFGYDKAKDQVRIDVAPVASANTEWMRFTIDPVTTSSAVVTLNWEKVSVPMTVDVDVTKIVWKKIDRELASSYAAAANYALDSGERLEEGLTWVDRAMASGESTFTLWTKARLLQKLGRPAEALPLMERSIARAQTDKMPDEFLQLLASTQKSIQADAAKKR